MVCIGPRRIRRIRFPKRTGASRRFLPSNADRTCSQAGPSLAHGWLRTRGDERGGERAWEGEEGAKLAVMRFAGVCT